MDAYAGFGFAKVYTDKMAISSIDFLETKVLPVYKGFNIPLDRILTDNGKEYTTHWVNGKHEYLKAIINSRGNARENSIVISIK